MALITPTAPNTALATQAAAGGGDTFANTGRERLYVKNAGGSGITVTIVSPGACSQGFTHDTAFTVTNGSDKVFPAFDPTRYGSTVSITYSGVTSVTVGVIS